MSNSLVPFGSDSDSDGLPASTLPIVGGGLNAPNGSADSPQLGDYIQVALRHWRMIALATLGGCVCGVLVSWIQTPLYRAQASLEIQSINGDFLNMKQARPVDEDQQGPDALTDLQTQIEILQSEMLAQNTDRALRRRDALEHKAHPSSPVQGRWSDKVLKAVGDSLRVRSVGQTRIIRVQVDAPDPQLASDFANTLVAEYIQQNTKSRLQMTEAANEYTRGQLAETRKKLEAAEQALQAYAAKHELVSTADRQNVSADRLRQVQTDLLHARSDFMDKEARRQTAAAILPDALPDIAKDTDLQQLRSKLIDLQRQDAELSTIFKPDYSEVKKVRAQMAELRSVIEQQRKGILNRIDSEYRESRTRVRLLTGAFDEAMQRAVKEAQMAVQYDILKRDVDTTLNDYQATLGRSKELNVAAAIQTSNIRVIDMAKPPERPYSPKLPLNIALGMFSGFSLGMVSILIRDRSNQNLRYPGESMTRLGVPELASIGSIEGFSGKVKGLALRKTSGSLETERAVGGDDFRTLLTSIFFSGAAGKEPKLVVVTSCAPQDGKTTVVSNLGVALAKAGKRVLLIDGDLRRPQLHNVFRLPNASGFGNLLQACSKPAEAQRALLNTSVQGLSVLTSGTCTTAPADLLFDPHLRVLFSSYRNHFDMVIVDSPPMMRIPDARLLGRNADAVILVARANRTPRNSILLARHRLVLDHTKLLGIVLNDCSASSLPYQYEA